MASRNWDWTFSIAFSKESETSQRNEIWGSQLSKRQNLPFSRPSSLEMQPHQPGDIQISWHAHFLEAC
ncbi:uncharacterized protein PADG_08397 [Paracoccidioides brasiliensis Pb18]|uniref:Uncharacterized protein n=1 Tax=Paracoccidioides brasiliensis (strain Pb18) TaxID=502780 RepID=C1GM06_PARBD|nr:uncharacterized protein PADG_08397 [Paracoccidioides brasiliensis Pb18]EEH43472.2 hypothetical protein PADG_08397 [Paracoccidioides brasiliensis Pb18]